MTVPKLHVPQKVHMVQEVNKQKNFTFFDIECSQWSLINVFICDTKVTQYFGIKYKCLPKFNFDVPFEGHFQNAEYFLKIKQYSYSHSADSCI